MRIGEDILLQIFEKNELKSFKKINNQYTDTDHIDGFVWSDSAKPFPSALTEITAGRINKLFTNRIFDISTYPDVNKKFNTYTIYLRQGFKTQGIFSLLISIVSNDTNIFYNQIIPIESFRFNNGVMKLEGDFWTARYDFDVPNVSENNVFISIIPITYSDCDTDIHSNRYGFIYRYREIKDTLEPIIWEKILPDKIQTSITQKGSYYVIKPYHIDNNITIQKAITDYLHLNENNVNNFEVIHSVSVGNVSEENYRTNLYQNYDNPFGPVSIIPYVTKEMFESNNDIEIQVTTTYIVNNIYRLIRRTSKILPNIKQFLDNSIFDRLIATRFQPIKVEVNDNDVINNQIIETKEIVKYVELPVHKYVEMVTENKIKFERKIIGFKNLIKEPNKLYTLIIFSDDNSEVYNISALNNESYLTFDLNFTESDKLYKKLTKDGYLHYNIVQLIESFGNSEQIIQKGALIP